MRIKKIDILKTIGLICIILAHVNPPNIIFQLRNFDVILMIMISASLFFDKKFEFNRKNYKEYLAKRVKRLLLPTWLFLSIFFIISKLFSLSNYNFEIILDSYILNDGIGFVWIIRIYLLVAALLPIINYFIQKNFKVTSIIVGCIYIFYEIICSFGIFSNKYLYYFFSFIPPLILIIWITYWIKNNNSKKIFIYSVINLLLFILSCLLIYNITGKIHTTNFMKYPFRIYYLSYAMAVSSILIIIFRKNKISDLLYNKLIQFFSSHSLWIYLWHILIIVIIRNKFNEINWLLKFIIVVLFSVLITWIQSLIINFLESKHVKNNILSLFKG